MVSGRLNDHPRLFFATALGTPNFCDLPYFQPKPTRIITWLATASGTFDQPRIALDFLCLLPE